MPEAGIDPGPLAAQSNAFSSGPPSQLNVNSCCESIDLKPSILKARTNNILIANEQVVHVVFGVTLLYYTLFVTKCPKKQMLNTCTLNA